MSRPAPSCAAPEVADQISDPRVGQAFAQQPGQEADGHGRQACHPQQLDGDLARPVLYAAMRCRIDNQHSEQHGNRASAEEGRCKHAAFAAPRLPVTADHQDGEPCHEGKPTERHAAEQNGPDVRIVDHSEGGTATPGPTRRRVWPEREEPGHYLNRGVAVGNPNEPALPDPCQVAGGEGQEDMTEEGRLHRGHREAQSPAHIGDEAVVGNAETRHRIDGYQDGEQNHQPAHAPVRAEPARHPADGCPDGHVRDGRQDESPARAGPPNGRQHDVDRDRHRDSSEQCRHAAGRRQRCLARCRR